MPTIDDLIADLNGAIHFSALDLSSGYHQLELSPESRFITTFRTHVGSETLQAPTLWHALTQHLQSSRNRSKNFSQAYQDVRTFQIAS